MRYDGCFFDFLAGYYLVWAYSVTLCLVRDMGVTPIVGAGHIDSEEGRNDGLTVFGI